MIDIREMTPADLDAVLALRREWLPTGSKDCGDALLERNWFAAYPGNTKAFALVATDAGKLVAYLLCSWHGHPAMAGTAAEIDEIHVAKAYRGQGLGRELVDRALRMLQVRVSDLNAVRSTVDKDDQEARAFWHSIGFEHHVVEYTHYLE